MERSGEALRRHRMTGQIFEHWVFCLQCVDLGGERLGEFCNDARIHVRRRHQDCGDAKAWNVRPQSIISAWNSRLGEIGSRGDERVDRGTLHGQQVERAGALDTAALTRRGILLTNTPIPVRNAVATTAVAFLLALTLSLQPLRLRERPVGGIQTVSGRAKNVPNLGPGGGRFRYSQLVP